MAKDSTSRQMKNKHGRWQFTRLYNSIWNLSSTYEFDERVLKESTELKVKQFSTYDEEWAEFIFANRNKTSAQPAHDYDIVIGPIANDRVGLQIRHYMEHNIDLPTFIERLKFMKGITFQYFFGTERAIKLLKKV